MGLKKIAQGALILLSLESYLLWPNQKKEEIRPIPALKNRVLTLSYKRRHLMTEGNHIVVNLPAFELYFCKNNEIIKKYPISIGKPRIPSPEGHFKIDSKTKDPCYRPVKGSEYKKIADSFPPGINNPMGTRVMHFVGHMYIHGLAEDKRDYIRKVKGGRCLGMLKEDVEELYPYVKLGTPVDVYYKLNLIRNRNSGIAFKSFENIYKGKRLHTTKEEADTFIDEIYKLTRKNPASYVCQPQLSETDPKS